MLGLAYRRAVAAGAAAAGQAHHRAVAAVTAAGLAHHHAVAAVAAAGLAHHRAVAAVAAGGGGAYTCIHVGFHDDDAPAVM